MYIEAGKLQKYYTFFSFLSGRFTEKGDMGRTGKWLRNFLTGNKDRKEKDSKNGSDHQNFSVFNVNEQHPSTPLTIPQPTTPREKRRWSFRRSSATAPGRNDSNSLDNIAFTPPHVMDHHLEDDAKKHVLAVAVATAAAADPAVAAAKAAAAMIQLTAASSERASFAVEEAVAVKIQSVFRSYLARKALNALKGLVKLQALVRGHLVRKQANATLRCMQALVNAQARARVRRMLFTEESSSKNSNQKQFNHRKSTHEYKFTNSSQDIDRGLEENIKIVEMDIGNYKQVAKPRNSYSSHERTEHRISTHRVPVKHDHPQISLSPSAITDITPRTCSNHFEECSYGTAQSSPQCCYSAMSKPELPTIPFSYARSEYAESLYNDEYPFYPNYMAFTESSKAKVRSHSTPKQRPTEPFEKPLTRRKPSLEGRNVPRAVKMQRSSSNLGSNAQNFQYPWSVKLDRSTVSLKDSECGSTNTVLTNTNYCRSLMGFDVQGARF